jgi:hypothetical protein
MGVRDERKKGWITRYRRDGAGKRGEGGLKGEKGEREKKCQRVLL